MIKNCRTCAFKIQDQNVCRLFNMEINPGKDFCSKHRYEVSTCNICGAAFLQGIVIPTEEGHIEICEECAKKLKTCNFCKNIQTCKFETDPSPLPKMIQQRIPFIQAAVTVKNPERVKITCQTGCACYNESCNACCREYGACQNIEYVSLKNFQKR